MKLDLKVVPHASRSRIVGWMGSRLKVTVTAAPERGRANEAVIDALASGLGIARTRIRMIAGGHAPLKTVDISGDEAWRAKLPPREVPGGPPSGRRSS